MEATNESKPFILSDPLLPSSPDNSQFPPITYSHSHRPYRDLPFSLLFLLLSLSTLSLGLFSSFHSNPNKCNSHSLSLSSSSPFLLNLIPTLLITLLLSFPVAFSLLILLRHFAKHLVYVSIPFSILLPIFLNVYWFVACQIKVSCRGAFPLPYRVIVLVMIFFLIGVVGWIVVSNWYRVKLTVEVIRIGAAALGGNLLLLVVLPCLTVGLVVYGGVIVVFLVFATRNGRIVGREGEGGLYYCEWEQDGWVPGYFALAIVTLLWSFGSVIEAKVYVTSGVIARWYFLVEEGVRPRGSLRSSLRYGGTIKKFLS